MQISQMCTGWYSDSMQSAYLLVGAAQYHLQAIDILLTTELCQDVAPQADISGRTTATTQTITSNGLTGMEETTTISLSHSVQLQEMCPTIPITYSSRAPSTGGSQCGM